MAEGIIRDMALEKGLNIEFDSCGTGDWHVGDEPDLRAQACMNEKGSDISDLRGRQFHPDDFQNFDRIYTMDQSNYNNVLALATNEQDRKKVNMIMNEIYPGENRSVPDPYFGGEDGFTKVHEMLTMAAQQVLSNLKGE
ncbi:MAG: low molecular weight protein-tyrosine-phosphatase [Salibacteraceae bacterium]